MKNIRASKKEILTEMYRNKMMDFHYDVIEAEGECPSEEQEDTLRTQLTELIKANIKDKGLLKNIVTMVDDLETAYKMTDDWWGERCYIAGYLDCEDLHNG